MNDDYGYDRYDSYSPQAQRAAELRRAALLEQLLGDRGLGQPEAKTRKVSFGFTPGATTEQIQVAK